MLRKSHRILDFIPAISFLIMLIIAIALYTIWHSDVKGVYKTDFELAAQYYFQPMIFIFGTAVLLYFAELLKIITITRRKSISIILIILISLLIVWAMLIFASLCNTGEHQLLGRGIQNLISKLPKSIFPVQVGLLFFVHINDYVGLLFCELLGIGVFIAIGSKNNTERK